ncbi:putative Dedicator of cytokinesis protein, partial [Daphnia magna]
CPPQHRPLSLPPQRKHNRRISQPEVHLNVENVGLDAEINSCLKGVDRANNVKSGNDFTSTAWPSQRKLLHEEIGLLWAMSTNASRDVVFSNAWFFFELIVKSMVEYLGSTQKLDCPRKQRFPERFLEDIGRLVSLVTAEILSRQRRDGGESKSALLLNIHLSFFLHDLLSVMDRGFCFLPDSFLYPYAGRRQGTLPKRNSAHRKSKVGLLARNMQPRALRRA